jgi:hypothetical protein
MSLEFKFITRAVSENEKKTTVKIILLIDVEKHKNRYIYIYTLTTRHEGIQHETVHDTGNTDIKKN